MIVAGVIAMIMIVIGVGVVVRVFEIESRLIELMNVRFENVVQLHRHHRMQPIHHEGGAACAITLNGPGEAVGAPARAGG